MATIVKTPSGTWKAVIRKTGWPTTVKTFRLKKDAEDWARGTEDEMVRGMFIKRAPSERMTFEAAMKRYLAEVITICGGSNLTGQATSQGLSDGGTAHASVRKLRG